MRGICLHIHTCGTTRDVKMLRRRSRLQSVFLFDLLSSFATDIWICGPRIIPREAEGVIRDSEKPTKIPESVDSGLIMRWIMNECCCISERTNILSDTI
ncbi:hypothetical protein AVEN_213059-1 [Araneus ventricosus]|uniref:Uncharacterized protein n=1 Tax=Araneus ventricosus TaxID=182803 RepID=A0A4Y2FA41_ARAVE|nr:hypothetical protein AVEN_267504-1 [Araneus ventricosus]GBM37157.1 hypothetical protein AVEN_213059-1 [Araneus ventricosus]